MLKQKRLLIVAVIIALHAIGALVFFRTGVGRNFKSYLAGKPWIRNGERVEYYPDGKIRMKQVRRNGKSDGPVTFWYNNGTKQREFLFADGERSGKCEGWHMNGVKALTGQFAGGKYEGKWQFFDTNGNQVAEMTCNNGRFWDGTDAKYVDDILLITKYKDGKIVSSEKRRD